MRPFVSTLWTQYDVQGAYIQTTFLFVHNGLSYIMRCKQPDAIVLRSTVPEVEAALREEAEGGRVLPAPGQVGGLSLLINWTLAFPRFDPTLTPAPANLGDDVYIKKVDLGDYGNLHEHDDRKQYMLSEARVYEIMQANNAGGGLNFMDGRKNICKYRGCVIERHDDVDYVAGLALDKVEQDLVTRCEEPHIPLDFGRVVQEVQQALHYLHELGYCHNDVNPQNIMLTKEDEAVLIDFDACRLEGEPLSKWPLLGYIDPEQTKSSKENDWYGLSKVEEMLREVFGGSA